MYEHTTIYCSVQYFLNFFKCAFFIVIVLPVLHPILNISSVFLISVNSSFVELFYSNFKLHSALDEDVLEKSSKPFKTSDRRVLTCLR